MNQHLSPLEFLKPKTHVICLLQCGGLWFVNGKISITWNLKQAIVQKPKQTMEGTCFLKPKASDKALMKTLPPPEEDVDPDGASATVVEDSDDEEDLPNYNNVEKVEVLEQVLEKVVEVEVEVQQEVKEEVKVEEVKAKKKIVRKKATE